MLGLNLSNVNKRDHRLAIHPASFLWISYTILFPYKHHTLPNSEAEITLRLQFNLIAAFISTEVVPLTYQRRYIIHCSREGYLNMHSECCLHIQVRYEITWQIDNLVFFIKFWYIKTMKPKTISFMTGLHWERPYLRHYINPGYNKQSSG